MLLIVFASAMPISLLTWSLLINNFSVEFASFTVREIGILQTVREIPGFFSFLVVYILSIVAEQRLAFISLFLLDFGFVITGFFPVAIGLYVTTIISSLGFHYYEACQQSLSLQWLDKKQAPAILGRIQGSAAITQFVTLATISGIYFFGTTQFSWSAMANSTGLITSAFTYTAIYVVAGP